MSEVQAVTENLAAPFQGPEASLPLKDFFDQQLIKFDRQKLLELLEVPSAWHLLALATEPLDIRLLLDSNLSPANVKVVIDLFATTAWRNNNQDLFGALELPQFPEMPFHRHDWPIAFHIYEGGFKNEFGIGTAEHVPASTKYELVDSGDTLYSLTPDYWHDARMISEYSLTFSLSSRERFSGPASGWRPRMHRIRDDRIKNALTSFCTERLSF